MTANQTKNRDNYEKKQCNQTWITPGVKYMSFKVETVHIKRSNLILILNCGSFCQKQNFVNNV